MIGGLHAPPVVPPSPLMQVWLIPLGGKKVKRSTRPEFSKLSLRHEKPVEYLPRRSSISRNRQGSLIQNSFSSWPSYVLCSQAQEECRTGVTNADERVLAARATQ